MPAEAVPLSWVALVLLVAEMALNLAAYVSPEAPLEVCYGPAKPSERFQRSEHVCSSRVAPVAP